MDAFVVVHENLIRKAINGQPGHPDWAGIMRLVNAVEAQPSSIDVFLELLVKHLKKDPSGLKYNSLMLIDALFKNGKKAQLARLQTKLLTSQLSAPEPSEEPQLQNFIHQNAKIWVDCCAKENCLNSDFDKWQKTICTYYFVPQLTDELRTKFYSDLDSAAEILGMFCQTLITTFAEQGNPQDPLLREININVLEISRRAEKLVQTLNDPKLRSFCSKIFEFAKCCIIQYEAFKKNGSFDTQLLTKSMMKVEAEQKSREQAKNAKSEEKPVKRTPLRTYGDDMADEDFFAEMAKLRAQRKGLQVQAQPVSTQQAVNDLLLLL